MAVNYKFIDEKVGLHAPANAADLVQQAELGYIALGLDPTYGIGEFKYVKFTGAVNAGDFVVMDAQGKTTVQSPAAAANAKGLTIGISMATQVAGQFGWVLLRGVHDGANVVTGTAAGALLSGSAVAGQASTAVANFNFDMATCKTLAAANVATVELYWPVCTGR